MKLKKNITFATCRAGAKPRPWRQLNPSIACAGLIKRLVHFAGLVHLLSEILNLYGSNASWPA
jgi:hypothetical protein